MTKTLNVLFIALFFALFSVSAFAQQMIETFIAELMSKAVIVNYMTNSTAINQTTNNTSNINNLDAFAKCLTLQNATLYGASWCPHCSNQKEMFGDSVKYLMYVECADSSNPQIQTPACEQAKIEGYPTWIINGKQYAGEQSLDGLSKLTGCKLN